MNKVLFYITLPIRFSYWMRLEKYSKEWDIKLNQLLDNNEFEIIDGYNAKLGDTKLWYENNPYSCFKYFIRLTPSYGYTVMPSRYTVYKANKKLDKAFKLLITKANKSI